MKTKNLLLILAATLIFAGSTIAQNVPSYVPPNGLVGWWPFNGNTNDVSGNGNNGVGYNVTSDTNRNNQVNQALFFNGTNSAVELPGNCLPATNSSYTINFWCKLNTTTDQLNGYTVFDDRDSLVWDYKGRFLVSLNNQTYDSWYQMGNSGPEIHLTNQSTFAWCNIACVYNSIAQKMYLYRNGAIVDSVNCSPNNYLGGNRKIQIGRAQSPTIYNGINYFTSHWLGGIDDIGLWNRALTPQEILDLFNAVNCANNIAIIPQNNSINKGGTAQFTASTSDSNPTFIWQSDFGQGFQTLNNFGNYSGANSSNLNIANVQLSEHNQAFRVISTSGNCVDTSNVATISILDTCITTIFDTVIISVTDTLIINARLTGLSVPNNVNKLKVFPNPANTHITIDYGNYSLMNGYSVEITNSIGQKVFNATISQQTSFIDISSWTGNGVYFIKIINSQGNTIESRKILIQ